MIEGEMSADNSEMRLVLLGGGAIGAKTSLIYYFLHHCLNPDYDPTIEDSYHYSYNANGRLVSLNILGKLCLLFVRVCF